MIWKDFTGGVVKLHEGTDPAGLMGYVLRDASPHTNGGKMSCRVVISTESVDRSRDVVVTKGLDLSDHAKLPIVLIGHNRDLPIGYAEDQLGGYTVKMDGPSRLVGETFFSQSTEIGEQAFRLVENKVLRGASIGFTPIVVKKSAAGGKLYEEGKLIEYSHIPIPDNPDCLVSAVEKGFGGKALHPALLALLTPLVPTRPASVVSGWDGGKPQLKTKAMNQPDPEDEFQPPATPPTDGTDPNIVTPEVDPHADHKDTVDNAVGDILASIYDKFTQGTVDLAAATKLFKDCLEHHGKVKDLTGGDDLGDDMDLDADPDLDADDDEGTDDEDFDPDGTVDDDESDDDDYEPDDEDPKKKKHVRLWTRPAERVTCKIATFLDAVVKSHGRGRLDPAKAATHAAELRAEMDANFGTVRKAFRGRVVEKGGSPPLDTALLADLTRKMGDVQTVLGAFTR